MSLYLLVSDIHASDKAPASCTDSYGEDILDLLRQTVTVARRRKVTAVVWAGDVLHIKIPSRTSYGLINALSDIIRSYPCKVLIVPGNHDLRNDRLETVDRQPIGALYRAGAYRLEGWHDEHAVYGVPWLQGYGDWSGGETEEVDAKVGQAFEAYCEQVYEAGIGNRKALVVAHAPLYPPGKELQWEHFPARRWAEAMRGYGWVFYGHVHEPHGVYEVDGVTFCNNGALSRGSLHEYNLTRQVGCTLWDDETGEFEFVPLDAKPADQVFRLQEKNLATDMHGRLDGFLADVAGTTLDVLTPAAVLDHARQQKGIGHAELTLIEELLEQAAHERGRK